MIQPLLLLVALATGAFAYGMPPGHPRHLYNRGDTNASSSQSASASSLAFASASTLASSSPSASSTKALLLAAMLLSDSVANCTGAGGGCQVLGYSLPVCADDQCACQDDMTLAAMVCAECNANNTLITTYNGYLSLCQGEGYSHPSQTINVSVVGTSAAQSSPVGGTSASSATGSSTSSSATPLSSESSATALASTVVGGIRLTTLSDTSKVTTPPSSSSTGTSITGVVAFQESPDSYDSLSRTESFNGSSSSTTSTPTITATFLSSSSSPSPSSSGTPSVLALNAAIAYFASSVDSTCDADCSTWKSLSNACTQDLCICTTAGISSASACSQCLGKTTHGTTYQIQIQNYNAFMSNCSSKVTAPIPLSSSIMSGYEIVAAATSTSSLSENTTNGTKAAAEAVVTVTSKSHPQHALSIAVVWLDILVAMMGGALAGAFFL